MNVARLLQQIRDLKEALEILENELRSQESKYTPDSEEENRAKPRC